MYYIIVLLVLISAVTLQVIFEEEGSDCERSGVENGKCINIKSCESAKRLLRADDENRKAAYERLNELNCGFVGRESLVCCSDEVKNRYNLSPLETREFFGRGVNVELLRPPDCGGIYIYGFSFVVGGFAARIEDYPWLVALGYKSDSEPNLVKFLCGGSLISKRHVLTAAHCVRTTNHFELNFARFGDQDLYSENDGAHVSEIPIGFAKVHEEFDPRMKYTNDIAILYLEKDADNQTIKPICLPADEPIRSNNLVGSYLEVAGWGSERFEGPSSRILQTTTLPIVDNNQCRYALSEYIKVHIDDSTICAGYTQGGKDVCGGDSGGPLMYSEGGNIPRYLVFYAVGIVSYGHRCGEPNSPGVYTNVAHYLDWIQKNMFI